VLSAGRTHDGARRAIRGVRKVCARVTTRALDARNHKHDVGVMCACGLEVRIQSGLDSGEIVLRRSQTQRCDEGEEFVVTLTM